LMIMVSSEGPRERGLVAIDWFFFWSSPGTAGYRKSPDTYKRLHHNHDNFIYTILAQFLMDFDAD